MNEQRVWRICLHAFDNHDHQIPDLTGLSKDPTLDAEIINNMSIVNRHLKRDASKTLHTYFQFGHYYNILKQNCEREGTDFFPLLNKSGIKYARRYWFKLDEFYRLASVNRRMLSLGVTIGFINTNIKSIRSLCAKGNFR